jgi:hypothetical protein
MDMNHPFTGLVEHRALWLGALWTATIVLAGVLTVQGGPLRTSAAPRGILSLEFAWNSAAADSVIRSWPAGEPRERAKRQIWIDFAFLVAYPLALALSCALLSESRFDSMAPVGVFIAWAVLLAMPLDLVENLGMLRMLGVGASEGWARLTSWCAAVKFTLVFSGLGYAVLQGLAVLAGRLRGA